MHQDLNQPNSLYWVRRLWFPALILLIVIGISIALYGGWVATGRKAEVDEGRVYRCAALPAGRLQDYLRAHGIRTVIDLRKSEDAKGGVLTEREAKTCEAVGAAYVNLPADQVPSDEVVARFLQIMDDPKSYPVLVHCEHGVGRTGVMTAIYRMEFHDWSKERAIHEARLFSGFTRSFGRGTGKEQFLRGYQPRKNRTTNER